MSTRITPNKDTFYAVPQKQIEVMLKINCNNNSIFKISGDLPYEKNGENVHPNDQPQDPSDNIADNSDEDDNVFLSVTQKYENI